MISNNYIVEIMIALTLITTVSCMIYALVDLCTTIERENEKEIPVVISDKSTQIRNNEVTCNGIYYTKEFFV